MQWLIDIIKSQLKIAAGFVALPQTAAVHFDTSSWTRDDSFHDIDFTGIVPSGSTAVYCRLLGDFQINDALVRFYTKNGSPDQMWVGQRFRLAGKQYITNLLIPLDGDLKALYRISVSPVTMLRLQVIGYFEAHVI